MSELGPTWDLHMLVAALRADRSDVASYVRVLTGVLGDALPRDMVRVDYRRGLGDRLGGRAGRPVGVCVRGEARRLDLREEDGQSRAEIQSVVRDVVISRRAVSIEEWLAALAEELRTLAARDAAARDALARLLGG